MGQKVSTSHSSSEVSLSKKNSRDVKLKTKQFANWSRERINVEVKQNNLKTTIADTEKLDNDVGDDDDDGTQRNTDDEDEDTFEANSLAYPSIAELSNFTTLSMMRNLEDASLLNEAVNEKLMEDERCFNMINYEDVTVVQLVENATSTSLRRDSSTCTNEIKELSSDSLLDAANDVEEKRSCKDLSRQSALMEKSEEQEEDEEEETLAVKLQRAEHERDEARTKLRLVEVRCEAYEEESKCLEASMESMEEKLRTIVNELRHEVAKSKDLERQLSTSFESSMTTVAVDDGDVTRCEKLIVSPAALHS